MDNPTCAVSNGGQLPLSECFAASLDIRHRNSARVTPRPATPLTCTFVRYPQIQQGLLRVPTDIDLYRTKPIEEKQRSSKVSHPVHKIQSRKAVMIGGMS